MRVIPVILIAIFINQLPVAANAQPKSVLTKDVTGNREVRLLAARVSQRRGQNLEAKFAVVGSAKTSEVVIRFPCHSHTTHETTLMKIVSSCVEWSEPKSRHEWHDAKISVIFSLPKDASGYVTNFEKWWLVSLDLPKKK